MNTTATPTHHRYLAASPDPVASAARRTVTRALQAFGLLTLAMIGLAAFQLLSAETAHASELSWVGAPSGDGHSWGDARNWSPQSVPSPDDVVTIQQRPSGPSVVDGIPEGAVLKGLKLGPGGSIAGGSLSVTEQLDWTGGTVRMPVTVKVGATAAISQASSTPPRFYAKGALRLHGTTNWSGTLFAYPDQGFEDVVVNTGTFRAQAGARLSAGACCGNPFRFTNQGTISVQAPLSGAPAVISGVALINKSVGKIDLPHAASKLELRRAPSRFEHGSTLIGNTSGEVVVHDGANLALAGTLNSRTTLNLVSGYLSGKGTINGGRFVWTDGRITGAFTVSSTTATLITDDGPMTMNKSLRQTTTDPGGGVLTLAGPTTFDGTVGLTSGATIINTGVMTAKPGALLTVYSCCNKAQFENRGRLLVEGPVTQVTGGPPPVAFQYVALLNRGVVDLQHGGSKLVVEQGTFQQTSTGRLFVTLAGGTTGNGYSFLTSGEAKLAGTLSIRTASGFLPSPGDVFPGVVTATSARTGLFSQVLGTTLSNGGTYTVVYWPTTVDLKVR